MTEINQVLLHFENMIVLISIISRIICICLPGSSECDGDALKICDLSGEWIRINCPDNTKCGLENNKISCQRISDGIQQPTENKNDKEVSQDKEADTKNSTQEQPTEAIQPSAESQGENQESKKNEPEQTPKSEQKSTPDNGENQPKNDENKQNEQKNDENNQMSQPQPETTPSISENPIIEKIITIVTTVTQKESIEYPEQQKIEEEVLKTVKNPRLPCCDEDLKNSCRICKDSKPIRAIVIDRESLLGNDQQMQNNENPEQNTQDQSQNPSQQDNSDQSNDSGSKEDLSAFSGNETGNSNNSDQSDGEQSSGPPKKVKTNSNSNKNSKFLNNSSNIQSSKDTKSKTNKNQKRTTNLTTPNGSRKSNTQSSKMNPKLVANNSSNKGNESGGSNAQISESELGKIANKLGYNPTQQHLKALADELNQKIKDKSQSTMLIAQLIHESAGFTKLTEEGCKNNAEKCGKNYDDGKGVKGKAYYGRGYIQLSWAANYQAAGKGIGMGNQLLEEPDKVSEDPLIAAKVSIWYWKTRVMPQPGVKELQFGATTKAINGALECRGQNVQKSKNRWKIYLEVEKILKPPKKASEAGCYS